MNHLNRLLLSLTCCFCLSISLAQVQIGVGNWRTHLPYNSFQMLSLAGNRIAAAKDLSVVLYDLESGEVESLSRVQGMSEGLVTSMAYFDSEDALIIGMDNGFVNICRNGQCEIVSDISRSAIIGSKAIGHIFIRGSIAYLSTDFGVVVYDLTKREVRETWKELSADGTVNAVNALAFSFDGDSVFLATAQGILGSASSGVINKMAFENWKSYGLSAGLPSGPAQVIALIGERLYSGIEGNDLYFKENELWLPAGTAPSASRQYFHATLSKDKMKLVISANEKLIALDAQYQTNTPDGAGLSSPYDWLYLNDDLAYVADNSRGLVRKNGGNAEQIWINGPEQREAFGLCFGNKAMYVSSGGYNASYTRFFWERGFYTFTSEGSWDNKNRFNSALPSGFLDIVETAYQADQNALYLASFGEGLIAYQLSDNTIQTYTTANAPFALNKMGGVAVDQSGNIWVSNHDVPFGSPSVFRLSPNGNWSAYIPNTTIGRSALSIVPDNNGNKWVRLGTTGGNNGLMVLNENKNPNQVYLGTGENEGKLPDKKVNDVAIDKDGAVWLATNAGVAVFSNPGQFFNGAIPTCFTPIVDGFPLLFDKIISSIAVDGGNRKWIGTNDGLWLFNENGTEAIQYFNTENSPLPSNAIQEVAIMENTGEVFVSTDAGLISFGGNGTEADEIEKDIIIYPNPVSVQFGGEVAIRGLPENARIKISDVNGNLVAEGIANGGMYSWNVSNNEGIRATPGIYLVFATAPDGSSKEIGRVAITP